MNTRASSSARRRTISSRVCGSAVAVSAMRGTFAQQRRKLEAQRLAAAGRHEHEGVAACGDVRDDVLLRTAKFGVAEYRIQYMKRASARAFFQRSSRSRISPTCAESEFSSS